MSKVMRAYTYLRNLPTGVTTALGEPLIPVDILKFREYNDTEFKYCLIRFPDGQVLWSNTVPLYKKPGLRSESVKLTIREIRDYFRHGVS